jgi:hypothetical protein
MLVMGMAGIAGVFLDPEMVFTAALWIVLVGGAVTLAQRAVVARRVL